MAKLAAEFESMLLLQMLREMRSAGSWSAEGEEEGMGADALFDAIDVELASHLASQRGFGLANVLSPALAPLVSAQEQGVEGSTSPLPPMPTALPTAALPTPDAAPPVAPAREVAATASSAFGWRRDPFHGGAAFHRGVDLRAAYGEPVGAAASGTVVFAGEQGGYGHTVVVEHAGGVRTRYAHLSAVQVGVGDVVQAGAHVGRVGQSGRATGAHLHFEVTRNGQVVDPANTGLTPLKSTARAADWSRAKVSRPGSQG